MPPVQYMPIVQNLHATISIYACHYSSIHAMNATSSMKTIWSTHATISVHALHASYTTHETNFTHVSLIQYMSFTFLRLLFQYFSNHNNLVQLCSKFFQSKWVVIMLSNNWYSSFFHWLFNSAPPHHSDLFLAIANVNSFGIVADDEAAVFSLHTPLQFPTL